jgi:hypothetical protein
MNFILQRLPRRELLALPSYVRMIASMASFKCVANLGHAVTNRAKSGSDNFCVPPCVP